MTTTFRKIMCDVHVMYVDGVTSPYRPELAKMYQKHRIHFRVSSCVVLHSFAWKSTKMLKILLAIIISATVIYSRYIRLREKTLLRFLMRTGQSLLYLRTKVCPVQNNLFPLTPQSAQFVVVFHRWHRPTKIFQTIAQHSGLYNTIRRQYAEIDMIIWILEKSVS